MKSVCMSDETLYRHKEDILGHRIFLQQTLLRNEHLSSNVHRLSGVVSYAAKRWDQKPNGLWERSAPNYKIRMQCKLSDCFSLTWELQSTCPHLLLG